MESILIVVALAIVLPAAVGSLGAVVARFLGAGGAGRPVALSLALGFGLVAGYPGAAGFPTFPPVDSMQWLPLLSLAAVLVLVVFEGQAPRLGTVVWALVAALGAAGGYLVGRPTFATASLGLIVPALALTALGGAVASASLDSAARRLPVWSVLASLLVVATGASLASLFSHTALFAMLLGGIAAALGGMMAAGLLFKSLAVPRAGLAAFVVTLACQLLYVRLYAGMSLVALSLAGASLFAPYAVARLVPERVRARPFLAVALTGLLAGAAVLAAFLADSAAGAGGGSGGGDYVG